MNLVNSFEDFEKVVFKLPETEYPFNGYKEVICRIVKMASHNVIQYSRVFDGTETLENPTKWDMWLVLDNYTQNHKKHIFLQANLLVCRKRKTINENINPVCLKIRSMEKRFNNRKEHA